MDGARQWRGVILHTRRRYLLCTLRELARTFPGLSEANWTLFIAKLCRVSEPPISKLQGGPRDSSEHMH